VEKNNRRIVILSDTHLGRGNRGGRSAQALRPLWANATDLVINGDVAEIADTRYRVQAALQVNQLQEFCDEDGVLLTLLSGNHDPQINDVRYLTLLNGQVFITHGDVLHPAISPWSPQAARLQRINEQALSVIDPDLRSSFDSRLAASQHASHIKWDPVPGLDQPKRSGLGNLWFKIKRVAAVLWHWQAMPYRAVKLMKRHIPQARFFIFGHMHHAGIWTFGRRVIINTGCYDFPGKPRAVIIEGSQMSIWPIRFNGSTFHYANRPIKSYQLTP